MAGAFVDWGVCCDRLRAGRQRPSVGYRWEGIWEGASCFCGALQRFAEMMVGLEGLLGCDMVLTQSR